MIDNTDLGKYKTKRKLIMQTNKNLTELIFDLK